MTGVGRPHRRDVGSQRALRRRIDPSSALFRQLSSDDQRELVNILQQCPSPSSIRAYLVGQQQQTRENRSSPPKEVRDFLQVLQVSGFQLYPMLSIGPDIEGYYKRGPSFAYQLVLYASGSVALGVEPLRSGKTGHVLIHVDGLVEEREGHPSFDR